MAMWLIAAYYGMPGDWPRELILTIEFSESKGETTLSLKQEGLPNKQAQNLPKWLDESLDKFTAMF